MHSNFLKKSLQSFVAIPILATNLFGSMIPMGLPSAVVLATDENRPLDAFSLDNKQEEISIEGKKIDAYFADRNMPLEGYGEKLASEAKKYGLDPYIIAAIAVRESTGGIHACKKATYSPFGYGSCKINFDSYDHAIEVVARSIGGENPKLPVYKDKTTEQILKIYNPEHIVKYYSNQVMAIMDDMREYEIEEGQFASLEVKA
mgnify:FL=1